MPTPPVQMKPALPFPALASHCAPAGILVAVKTTWLMLLGLIALRLRLSTRKLIGVLITKKELILTVSPILTGVARPPSEFPLVSVMPMPPPRAARQTCACAFCIGSRNVESPIRADVH